MGCIIRHLGRLHAFRDGVHTNRTCYLCEFLKANLLLQPALGFLPGQRVRISRVAPLGDPISIEMEGQEISLRRAEADLIEVKEIA